ncbi:MAG: phosphoribosylanthranilate isomerase [Acidobacteriota bacterium]|nr:phosphoribosylanthranilate isomerase [Acidobacteriota bacterium]
MVQVKVCGITRASDALAAVSLGATAVGFVFWPESRRYVTPEVAASIARGLTGVRTVGVFVNSSVAEMHKVAENVGLDSVQLHGDEPDDMYSKLSCSVIRAIGVVGKQTIAKVDRVPNNVMVLLDVHDQVQRGGTGRTVDWDVAATIAAKRQIFLAGGLRPDNVAAAIRSVRPYGIDVSSGVETSPGIKETDKLKALFYEVEQV